ncbi:hepatitis A virus cellular receptor 1 [Alosa pseudoharengus]|uniref:hepatitis A virus cellular receptor 1 n=1 Tax=Alosa pseudoharengus TaxID=34774 RepID=UPI003F8CA5B6
MESLTMPAACRYICLFSIVFPLLICLSTGTTVYGTVGENITLPCYYNSQYHGLISICWGTGDIPNMGCNNNILITDGHKVISRVSDRYRLMGNLTTGNVSLTIYDSIQFDSGKYFCRIHIPGWFNDEKYLIRLLIRKTPNPSFQSMTSESSITESHTKDHQCTILTEPTDTTLQYSEIEGQRVSHHPGVLVAVVLLVVVVVVVVTVVAVFLMRNRWRKMDPNVQINQASDPSVIYSNTGSSLGLFSREMAIENVYQLDDSDVYEPCL